MHASTPSSGAALLPLVRSRRLVSVGADGRIGFNAVARHAPSAFV